MQLPTLFIPPGVRLEPVTSVPWKCRGWGIWVQWHVSLGVGQRKADRSNPRNELYMAHKSLIPGMIPYTPLGVTPELRAWCKSRPPPGMAHKPSNLF